MTALQETRLPGEVPSRKKTTRAIGYDENRRPLLTASSSLFPTNCITSSDIGIWERIMMVRLNRSVSLNTVCAYEPFLPCPEKTKNAFYDSLSAAVKSIPTVKHLLLLEILLMSWEWYDSWPDSLIKSDVREQHANGKRLLEDRNPDMNLIWCWQGS